MLSSLIGLLIALIVRITLGTLSAEYTFLDDWIPYFNYICIALGVLCGIFIIIKIIKAIVGR